MMKFALFVLSIASLTLLATATDRVFPVDPIGAKRPFEVVIADAVQQIGAVRRQIERNIRISGRNTFDEIYSFNDVIAVGSPNFDKVIRAERSWTAGALAANDLHVYRGLQVVYAIAVATRNELGSNGADEQINIIIKKAGNEILDSLDTNRATVELLARRAFDRAVDLHNRAVAGIARGDSPIPYQTERLDELDASTQRVTVLSDQMLGEIKDAIDDALRQLGDLPPP